MSRKSRRYKRLASPRLPREAEKAAIERHIQKHGVTRRPWTPYNGEDWSLSDELNWIESQSVTNGGPRQPDAR